MRNLFFWVPLSATLPFQGQYMDSRSSSTNQPTEVQGWYTQPISNPPPPPTVFEPNYPRFSGNAVASGTEGNMDEYDLGEEVLEDDMGEDEDEPALEYKDGADLAEYEDENDLDEYENDRSNTVSNRRLLKDADEDQEPYRSHETKGVTELRDSADKQVYSHSHQGQTFSKVGCAYVGRACTAFYYPYSTYSKDDKSVDSSKVTVYDGYRQPSGVTGDTTNYNWNIMSSFPYIAKSPLFGKSKHGKAFDDVDSLWEMFTGKVVKVTMYGTTRVTSIQVEYEGGHSVRQGTQWEGEQQISIELDKDEDIVEGKFSNCRVRYNKARIALRTRLCGATLVTTKGRKVSLGRFGKTVYSTVAPKGFVFAGFFGRKGENIDQIGLVAIKPDAVQAARKSFPERQLDVPGWSKTQFPGLVVSSLQGGRWGKKFNSALTMPSNIMEMKLNKLLVHGNGVLTGFTFGYEDGSGIGIGGTKDKKPAIIDLGSTGRITSITITEFRVKRCKKNDCLGQLSRRRRYEKRLRTGGAIINYIDKDGVKQSVSRGKVNLKKYASKTLDIPTGMELVAAQGAQGTVLDNIAFFLRPSSKNENASVPSALPPLAP